MGARTPMVGPGLRPSAPRPATRQWFRLPPAPSPTRTRQKKGREAFPGPFSPVKQQVVQKALLTLTKNLSRAMSEDEVPLDKLRKRL